MSDNNATKKAPLQTQAVVIKDKVEPVPEEIAETRGLVSLAVQVRAAAVPREEAEAMLPAIKAMWPKDVQDNPPLGRLVARIAIAYGLDPIMNEITIYRGKPYITVDGWERKARDHERFRGMDPRPATDEERQQWRADPDDHLWRCEVYRDDWPKPVVGWGRVNPKREHPDSVAAKEPQHLARKRSIVRALRDAIGIPLPAVEDVEGYNPASQRYITAEGQIPHTRPGGNLAMQGHLAAIHIISKHLGIEDAERHEHLHQMFNKDATNELTEGEAATYLEWLGNMQAEREAKNPLVIEGKARDAAITQVPHETAQRFEARPDWPPARTYEEVFGETEPDTEAAMREDPIAEPEVELTPAERAAAEVEALMEMIPEDVSVALRRAHRALITGDPLAYQNDPKKRGVQAKGASDRLKLFQFTMEEVGALYVLAHFFETGELLDSQAAYKGVDARYFTGLQVCESAIIEGLHEAARWWLGSQKVTDHA